MSASPGPRTKAYEVVAADLRTRIMTGVLPRDERLPKETELADEFGVSRATIREALRLLAAQDLIRTAKGARGGSFVTVPRINDISQYLHSSLNLLTVAERVSLDELLEIRRVLEVPAAGLAARRRRENDLERLRATLPERGQKVGPSEEFEHNRDFHSVLTDACGNTLLQISVQPIFTILMTHFDRSSLGARFHRAIQLQHVEITEAIERADAPAAEKLMSEHLDFMRPYYERIWRPGGAG